MRIILIPLAAGLVYAIATIVLKRVLQDGARPWRVTFASNIVMAIGYQACWVLHTRPFSPIGAFHAAISATTFFAGQIFTFIALNRGDVSVVTPTLGTKVIYVAMFSVLLVGHGLSSHIWSAVFMTALGTAVLGYQPGAHPRRVALSIGAALATSGCFGLTDVLVMKFSPAWGFGSYIPTMFMIVGLYSFVFMPLLGKGSWSPAWLGAGTVLLAGQALAMAFVLSTMGHATEANIAYSARGLCTVILVWLCGHWFGNTERERGARTMALRFAGAALVVAGIFIASR